MTVEKMHLIDDAFIPMIRTPEPLRPIVNR